MISIKNLIKSFGAKDVLRGLDLEIRDGEILFIVGKSGSGKSVLIKHIIGLMKPDSGQVLINETEMTELEGPKLYERLTNIGMIFQGGALFDSMNIGENVTFHLRNHGTIAGEKIERSKIREYGEQALISVGLENTYKLFPSELSGGMRKRASIARALIYKPDILFYDEPTTGLDPITAQRIAELILTQHLELKGATTVVVSHDLVTTLYCADRIALIEDGKIVICESPMKFMKHDHESIKFFLKMIGHDLSLIRNKDK